jgi:hypothetical protein
VAFVLARALWRINADEHARAEALAQEALSLYAEEPSSEEEVGAIEGWLTNREAR